MGVRGVELARKKGCTYGIGNIDSYDRKRKQIGEKDTQKQINSFENGVGEVDGGGGDSEFLFGRTG